MARRRRVMAVGIVAAVLAVGVATAVGVLTRPPAADRTGAVTAPPPTPDAAPPTPDVPPPPARRVDVDAGRVVEHLEALQAVADANGGNRAAGQPGFQASVDYVVGVLTDAGYTPELHDIEIPATNDRSELTLLAPTEQAYATETDIAGATFRTDGPLDATGDVVAVDLDLAGAERTTSGCEPADFAAFPAGAVALVRRGTCHTSVKALNAQRAGAVGVVIMNEGTTGRTGVFAPQGAAPGVTIPVIGTTYEIGSTLAATPGARLRLVQLVDRTPVVATSIVVETAGDPDDVVMVGAHLDGAPDGPGMNDNASGSAAILALAEQLAGTDTGATVRFAWWAGEELGLLGSNAYVAQLPQAERNRIVTYLNVDMIASPNARFEIYDGDESGPPAWVPVPAGSAEVERVFQGVLADRGEPYEDSELDAASDYVAFAEAGIPIGGLFTGASGAKSSADADRYGGASGVDYDLCYHEACDSLTPPEVPAGYRELGKQATLMGNINVQVLDLMTDTLATAVVEIAGDAARIGRARRGPPALTFRPPPARPGQNGRHAPSSDRDPPGPQRPGDRAAHGRPGGEWAQRDAGRVRAPRRRPRGRRGRARGRERRHRAPRRARRAARREHPDRGGPGLGLPAQL